MSFGEKTEFGFLEFGSLLPLDMTRGLLFVTPDVIRWFLEKKNPNSVCSVLGLWWLEI
jgi:hypothetical protein